MSTDFCLISDLANYEPVYLRDKIIEIRNKGEMQLNAIQRDYLFNKKQKTNDQ